ncbi:MerR family transcriptional regulator [Roseateles sp. PN1]|uniref:MerR family transcriptional regulator n=1 Tax=Roseateles sp. PN1 TaxID=3137372 RepID=UPI0031395CF7
MNTTASISIGLLARQAGCSVPTIRYYEEIGLLPAVPRTDGGRRVYGTETVRRLSFIRRCRDFGFSIEQVRELVGLVDEPNRPCVEVREVAAKHLSQVRDKLAELQALERNMAAFVGSCDTACAGGAAVDCTILEDLASPGDAPMLSASESPSDRASGCCR